MKIDVQSLPLMVSQVPGSYPGRKTPRERGGGGALNCVFHPGAGTILSPLALRRRPLLTHNNLLCSTAIGRMP